jgi:four helix bundle protein
MRDSGYMNYEEWLKSVPMEITGDPLWTVEAYRLALFAAELGWHDVTKLMKDKRTVELSDQLYRALGSIGANISEGYSRGGGRDRARFYEYALGSARESRGWYCNGRHVLGETVAEHRIHLLTQIIRLLLRMVPDQRSATFHEDGPAYRANSETADQEPPHRANLDASLHLDAPLP